MVTKMDVNHDAFQAFRQRERIETAHQRRRAIEDLIAFVANAPPRVGTRQWQRAAEFIQGLHGRAWLDEARVVPPDRIDPWPQVSPARVRQVHAELRRGLLLLFPIDDVRHWERRLWRPPFRANHHPALLHYHHRVARISEASWPDTLWIAVMGLLEEFGRQIRRCPTCTERRLFLKRKRQHYCSQACSQRVRSARWYQQHRQDARERRHQMYKRQVLKGRKGIVSRRRRSASGT